MEGRKKSIPGISRTGAMNERTWSIQGTAKSSVCVNRIIQPSASKVKL